MKKIFSIVCACLVMMGANAGVVAPKHAPAGQAIEVQIDADYCQFWNMNGCEYQFGEAGSMWEDGCYRVCFVKTSDQGERTMFYTYIYVGGTNINTIADMGIYGAADPGACVVSNSVQNLNEGELTVSYVENVTFSGMDVKKYDFYFEALGEDGNIYYGTVQLPVLGINKAAYDKDPKGEGVFFATTDNGYLYQAQSGSVNANYSEYEITTQDDYCNYLQQYGVLFLYGQNTVAGVPSSMSLQFVVGQNAQLGLGIPAGVYSIDKTDNIGTVSASIGVYGGFPYESYATTYEYSGGEYYIDAYWYLASGTVIVGEDNGKLKITVDARTNNNLPVYAVFYNGSTPVENVEAEENAAAKRIDANGQLIINRNGVDYNVLGF